MKLSVAKKLQLSTIAMLIAILGIFGVYKWLDSKANFMKASNTQKEILLKAVLLYIDDYIQEKSDKLASVATTLEQRKSLAKVLDTLQENITEQYCKSIANHI